MTSITELIEIVLKDTNGNLSKVSRELGLDYKELRARQEENSFEFIRFPTPDYKMPEDIGSLSIYTFWAHYVVAVKARGTSWPNKFESALAKARRDFDAGRTIMCQSHHPDGWVVQYSIPRKKPLRTPQPFFSIDWSAR